MRLIEKWVGTTMKIDCEFTEQYNFTAEKQLELIKWIAFHENGLSILSVTDDRNEFVMESDYVWGNYHKRTKKIKDFSQALVSLIIQLWNDLTDAQKAEIKRILE